MNFFNRFDDDTPIPLDAAKDMNRVKGYVNQGIMSAEEGSRLIDNTHRFYQEKQKQSGINGMPLADSRHYTEGSLPEGIRPGTRPANENSGLYNMMDRGMTVGRRDGITPREREQQDLEAHKEYLLKEQRRDQLKKIVGPHSEIHSTQLGSAEYAENFWLDVIPDSIGLFSPQNAHYYKATPPNPKLHPKELKELHPYYYILGKEIPEWQPIKILKPIIAGLNEPEGSTPLERIINRGINTSLTFLGGEASRKIQEKAKPIGRKIWNELKKLPSE